MNSPRSQSVAGTPTAFIIRGFTLNTTAADADSTELCKAIASKGYRVVPVRVTWNHKTVSAFVEQFVTIYNKEKSGYNVIIGGSLGAMAAFVAAPLLAPDRLILCSLSAFFSEDLNKYDARTQKRYYRWFGKRRWQNYKTLSADTIAASLNKTGVAVTLLYGEHEKTLHPHLVARVNSTAARLNDSRLAEIPNCGHAMRTPEYVAAIKQTLEPTQ